MKEPLWSPSSWRNKKIEQAPDYPDAAVLSDVEARLSTYPPLVFAGEARKLKKQLALAAEGKAFVLQGGDCAESFSDFRANTIRDTFRILLQMSVILTFGMKKSVIKIGRMAGQFGKPRSKGTEKRGDDEFPVYRGDIINGFDFALNTRTPDPLRMERAYVQAASTLNLLRAFSQGGFADLHQVHRWNLDFVKKSPQNELYESIAKRLEDTLAFMTAIGISTEKMPQIQEIEFYTSHEALLLNYEQALTRQDSTTSRPQENYEGDWYNCSAHMLWVGDRTRQLDGAHIEYLRGIHNPIGMKCGPSLNPGDLIALIDRLNPKNEPGRLTLISRMGYDKIEKLLPPLLETVKREGRIVTWICDPMHGNTITASNGYKTRKLEHVLSEVRSFLKVMGEHSAHPGGVHFELTGKDVQECLGGDQAITETNLGEGLYETLCDPRLNASQALELAFQLCDRRALKR